MTAANDRIVGKFCRKASAGCWFSDAKHVHELRRPGVGEEFSEHAVAQRGVVTGSIQHPGDVVVIQPNLPDENFFIGYPLTGRPLGSVTLVAPPAWQLGLAGRFCGG